MWGLLTCQVGETFLFFSYAVLFEVALDFKAPTWKCLFSNYYFVWLVFHSGVFRRLVFDHVIMKGVYCSIHRRLLSWGVSCAAVGLGLGNSVGQFCQARLALLWCFLTPRLHQVVWLGKFDCQRLIVITMNPLSHLEMFSFSRPIFSIAADSPSRFDRSRVEVVALWYLNMSYKIATFKLFWVPMDTDVSQVRRVISHISGWGLDGFIL